MKNQVIEELERYVQGTLGVPLSIQPWSGGRNLPFFLKDQYAFFQAKIADLSCILIVAASTLILCNPGQAVRRSFMFKSR
jgi:hypothetical protein